VNVAFKAENLNQDPDRLADVGQKLLYRGWPRLLKKGGTLSVNGASGEQMLVNDIAILVFGMIPKAFSLSITNGKVTGSETTAAMINDAARKMLRVAAPESMQPG
jgi:hypothetical protein